MGQVEAMLQELEQEGQTTRRLLERVPDDRLTWRPHAKSMSLGQLALHVAVIPGAIAEMSLRSPFQAPNFAAPSAQRAEELLPALDVSLAKARKALTGQDDASLESIWTMVDGEKELFSLPRGALLRSLMLNHWYHHRGQLSVYLRELDVPVPSIYGPSADENPLG